jgi:FkbM family methyltransferase
VKLLPSRVALVQKLIHLNENLFFYPRLKAFYSEALKNKKPVIVDVGVNRGQSIDFFLKISEHSTVFGFEPNQKLFHLLKSKYEAAQNIKVFQLGVSRQKGKLVFHENIMDETSTFETVNPDSKYLRMKARVLRVKHVSQLIMRILG